MKIVAFNPLLGLLFFLWAIWPGQLIAQTQAESTYQQKLQAAESSLYAIGTPIPPSSYRFGTVSGSPYLFEQWLPGDLRLESGFVHEGVDLKLDVYHDLILFQGEKGLVSLHKDFIHSFNLYHEEEVFNFVKTSLEGKNATFCELLYAGPTRLLKYYRKVIVQTRELQGTQYPDAFADKARYYLQRQQSPPEEVKLNKASVLKRLNTQAEALRAYLRENELDLRSEEQLLQLLRYFDSL
ncbi:MAG: hypothetical protein D6730_08615 [Bacteroidetes bacterium]|nr:MAG: hypothetical protein D6730_08615 [Bacteroidota bacterium]